MITMTLLIVIIIATNYILLLLLLLDSKHIISSLLYVCVYTNASAHITDVRDRLEC